MIDGKRRAAGASIAGKSCSPSFLDRAPRVALIVFLLLCVVSFALAVIYGRDQTFFFDEWAFLAARDAGSLDSLLRPHNEHWTTFPILAYRAMWSLVGLHSYLPYQLMSISLHVIAAGLLRAVMRRSDVAPWIATAAAGLFALFGAGAQDIFLAFQITFVGSLAFGLGQLLLADHDGPADWRDCLAVAAGLASLMCSGTGVSMVFIVGVAVLLNSGWRRALAQTAPLALVFLAWWFTYGQSGVEGYHATPRQVLVFVARGVVETFSALGQSPAVGLLLAGIIPAGIVMSWQASGWTGLRARFGTPAALVLGSFVFLAISGYGRGYFGAEAARASRYLDLVAAMWLPLIAAAATVIARRWRLAGVLVIALLLIGTIGNTKLLWEYPLKTPGSRAFVNQVLVLAHSDLLAGVPDHVKPFPEFARDISAGWLADGVRSGRIPQPGPGPIEAGLRESLQFRLSFAQGTREEQGAACEALTMPVDLDLEQGNRLIFGGMRLHIADRSAQNPESRTVDYLANVKQGFGNGIDVLAPVKVRLSAGNPAPVDIAVCR
jgi:hypothetical protein